MISQFEKRASTSEPIGGKLKFEVDGVGIIIDGTSDNNTVIASDEEADCTISLTAEVLEKLRDGEINPMMAVMGGQIKISGDMGLAMKVHLYSVQWGSTTKLIYFTIYSNKIFTLTGLDCKTKLYNSCLNHSTMGI